MRNSSKLKTLSTVAVISVAAFVYFLQNHSPSSESKNTDGLASAFNAVDAVNPEGVAANVDNKALDTSSQVTISAPETTEGAERENTAVKSEKLLSKQRIANEFFANFVLDSEESLNNVYLSSDHVVSKQALQNSFLTDDFNNLINRVRNLEKSQLASNRELSLSTKLYGELGSKVFDEDYACSGKICLVSFKHNSLEQQEIQSIETFGQHYSFNNFSQNDLGESTYKGVFIATENPSRLKIK